MHCRRRSQSSETESGQLPARGCGDRRDRGVLKRPKINRIRFGLLAAALVVLFGLMPAAAPADDAPPAPTLASNSATYAPGDTVTLSGASWMPNENVHIHVADNAGKNWSRDVDVTAALDGSISDTFALPTSFAGGFGATATSALGATATTSFTNAFAAASAPPTMISDQSDYSPGATVTLSGANWRPGEPVHLFVNDDQGKTWSYNTDVTADSNGGLINQFQLPTSFVATYSVVATGATSGTATTSFTDGNLAI